jgi:hypothetical protein
MNIHVFKLIAINIDVNVVDGHTSLGNFFE